jgi:SEFIR domain-containing protein
MASDPPEVLISYSHDSPEHKDRVLQLAERLRGDGVEVQIDQYVRRRGTTKRPFASKPGVPSNHAAIPCPARGCQDIPQRALLLGFSIGLSA